MIFVECNADDTLVKCLTNTPKANIIHDFTGKPGVCTQLMRNWTDSKGLIDEDPRAGQPPYVKKARPHGKTIQYDIKYLRDASRNNYLIVLCPKLEDWILKSAEIADIDVTRHSLPNDANALHRVIDYRLNEFRILIRMMIRKKSNRILALKGLL